MIAVVAMGMVTISSCSKEKGDAVIAMPSRKTLILKTWVIEKYLENGVDITSYIHQFLPEYALDFLKDGKLEISTIGDRRTGKWSMDDKEENVDLLIDGNTYPYIYKILRLTDKEMWLSADADTNKIEIHFKPKL